MTKFRFFKKNLQTKGPKIAKESALKSLLETEDTSNTLTQPLLRDGLKAAIESKHATDKILAMMKLRSMISTKKLGPGDDKQTTHIEFPLSNPTTAKIKAFLTGYERNGEDPIPIDTFMTSYNSLGKLAKTKISWVITKMHNPKELAKLALTTEQRSDKRNEVRALLKFIQENPITPESAIIGTIINKNKKNTEHKDQDYRVYILDVPTFLQRVYNSNGVKLSTEFQTALEQYKDISAPSPQAFKNGLPENGNKYIKIYNTKLKELMDKGSIAHKYPAITSAEKLAADMQKVTAAEDKKLEASTQQYKRTLSQKNEILTFLETVIPKLLETFKTKEKTNDKTFELSRYQLLAIAGDDTIFSNYPDGNTKLTNLLQKLIPALSHKDYLKCYSHLRNATEVPDVWILGFKEYIEKYEKDNPNFHPHPKLNQPLRL